MLKNWETPLACVGEAVQRRGAKGMKRWGPVAPATAPHLPYSHPHTEHIYPYQSNFRVCHALSSPSYLPRLFILLRMPFIQQLLNPQTSAEAAPAL